MDSKDLSITIGQLIVIVLSLTAFYSVITDSSASDINAYTSVVGNQIRTNLIYLASLKSGVIKMDLPAKYNVDINQNDVIVYYKGSETPNDKYVLNHGLVDKIISSETHSKHICLSKHLDENCNSVIEVCNYGEECCILKELDCGTGNTKTEESK